VVVPNGYETGKFAPDETAGAAIRQELGIGTQLPVVGLVGRWHPDKDHLTLIAAFARVTGHFPDAKLLLAGTGCSDDNAALVAQIKDHGLQGAVRLLGRRGDIPAIMNALDLHVLSSRSEAFPNVVAEAMACDTPCVVTDVGDAALIVGNTGWVVPPRDPERLAEAIVKALRERADAKQWQSRSRAARQRILNEFSLENMVKRYHRVWGLKST
jgi:glycosyltransferase involved in cell wall biosynthesis